MKDKFWGLIFIILGHIKSESMVTPSKTWFSTAGYAYPD